jgi:hypothetical protein
MSVKWYKGRYHILFLKYNIIYKYINTFFLNIFKNCVHWVSHEFSACIWWEIMPVGKTDLTTPEHHNIMMARFPA